MKEELTKIFSGIFHKHRRKYYRYRFNNLGLFFESLWVCECGKIGKEYLHNFTLLGFTIEKAIEEMKETDYEYKNLQV